MDKMISKAIDSERIAIDMIATGMIEETSIDERYKMKKEQLDKAVDILATAKKIDYEKVYKRGKRRGIIVGAIGIIGTIAAGILAIKYGWDHEKNRYSEGYAEFPEKRIYDKELAKFVSDHTSFLDRFDIHKTVDSAVLGFSMLEGGVDIPKDKNWKF